MKKEAGQQTVTASIASSTPSPRSPTLRTVVRSSGWSAADMLIRTGGQFIITVALARLLQPSDFGLWALAMIAATIAITLISTAVSTPLLRNYASTREEESTLMWLGCIASVLAACTIYVVAAPLASFFGQDRLRHLIAMAACTVILAAPATVPTAILTRELRFGRMAIVSAISVAAGGTIAIAMARAGRGAESFAGFTISMSAIQTIGLLLAARWLPTGFRLSSAREALHFGKWMSMSAGLDIVYLQSSTALLGRFYGAGDVGIFGRANALQATLQTVITGLVGRMAMPVFSANAHDRDRMRRGLELALRLTMLIHIPAMIGLALVADLLIEVLYGEKWSAAVPLLSILAIGGIAYPVNLLNLQMLASLGLSKDSFSIEINKKLFAFLILIISIPFGMKAICAGISVSCFYSIFVNSRMSKALLAYPICSQIRSLRDLAVPSAVMVATVVIARASIDAAPLIELAITVCAGGLSYLASGFLSDSTSFIAMRNAIGSAGTKCAKMGSN